MSAEQDGGTWLKLNDAEYRDALNEMVDILHHRGAITSRLPADACHRDSTGVDPMLSATVILKATGKPAGQFFEPAAGRVDQTPWIA
ncbi:hypothetical protein ACFVXG_09580 [Kitasatospora sp. NPDC058162]|uniref:hypothetical protein n=1 Tax=Kitasatospora sp. NPDC058162 TaxID=3346362 RepID=UPI0036DA08DA